MGFLRPAGSWLKVILAGSLLMAVLWIIAGCEDSAVDPVAVQNVPINENLIDSVSVPPFWVLDSEEFRTASLTLNLSNDVKNAVRNGDLEEAIVYLHIWNENLEESHSVLEMHDDGGTTELIPQEDFEDVNSGDLIPGDYVYQMQLNSGFALEEGVYTFGFALDGLYDPTQGHPQVVPLPILSVDVTVSANEGPVIGDVSIPDSLYAGFDAQQWTIEVSDPNEPSGDEVVKVEVGLWAPDLGSKNFLFAPLNPPTWTFAVDSTFSAGLPTGDYSMTIIAIDKFDQPSDLRVSTIWVENLAPELLSLSTPDTVQQPGPDDPPNVYAFELNIEDRQGQGDIESVYYTVVDPTGVFFESPDFVFTDDGEHGDPIADDRVWTHLFQVANTVSNFGTYTFTFYAQDRAGNTSVPIEKEIELIVYSESQQ
jgi:hypothetical protein